MVAGFRIKADTVLEAAVAAVQLVTAVDTAAVAAAKGTTVAAELVVILEMAELGLMYLVPIRLDKVEAEQEDGTVPIKAVVAVAVALEYTAKA